MLINSYQYTPALQDLHLNGAYKNFVLFFQNPHISARDKTDYADRYLQQKLTEMGLMAVRELEQPEQMHHVFQKQHTRTCQLFSAYLQRRKDKAPREYFPTPSHAFEFLIKAAPVKRVDGSWLYSTLQRWHMPEARDLILTYLEELGLGIAAANHVVIYDQLLEKFGLDIFTEELADAYYEQPAIQLALAYASDQYLPMVIGFNLGYEQLPLHLLITNYELQEIGIDPHYFNLHITIDNYHTGHAEKAIKTYQKYRAQSNDPEYFEQLAKAGYAMNDLGISSAQIIRELNPEHFIERIFQNKAVIGQMIHNNKCQMNGKTVNEWLSSPNTVIEFLNVMTEKGWIVRNAPAEQSRFWNMIHLPEGKMFGVFNAAEKQFIQDWIQGSSVPVKPLMRSSKMLQRAFCSAAADTCSQQLKQELQQIGSIEQRISFLIPHLAPHSHHTATGLWAARALAQLLFPYQLQDMIEDERRHGC